MLTMKINVSRNVLRVFILLKILIFAEDAFPTARPAQSLHQIVHPVEKPDFKIPHCVLYVEEIAKYATL